MPPIEERSQDGDRKHKESLTDVSVASDTEEESDSYEPPDVLSDCLDDEVTQWASGSVANHQVKPVNHSVPSGALPLEKPQSHVTWDVQATKCKPYDKSASEWVGFQVDDQALGANADSQRKKRQRTQG
jgi:hypothetical protein